MCIANRPSQFPKIGFYVLTLPLYPTHPLAHVQDLRKSDQCERRRIALLHSNGKTSLHERFRLLERNSSFWSGGRLPWDHLYALRDGADGEAECAARAVVRYLGEVSVLVEGDGLVARVAARHIALAAVDAHVLVE